MSDKTNQYKHLKKISEDERTRSFLSEDLQLNRKVICVILKKSASSSSGRDFLLHARTLGKLKHQGVLPFYDMGLLNQKFFYSYRPPPGKTVAELFRLKNHDHDFFKTTRFRNIILDQIADTISYAHSQGITLGKLSIETVNLGQFGEVIINDWTKSTSFKPEDLKSSEFKVKVNEDIRLLGCLGMNFYHLRDKTDRYSINSWNTAGASLPYELQTIYDKAYLGRPEPYPNIPAFQKDLKDYLAGKPLEANQGDILAFIRGFSRQHKKSVLLFTLLFTICFIYLFTQSIKLASSNNLLSSMETEKITVSNTLKDKKYELENSQQSKQYLEEEISFLETDIEDNNNDVNDFKNDINDWQNKVKLAKQKKINLKKELKQVSDNILLVDETIKKTNKNTTRPIRIKTVKDKSITTSDIHFLELSQSKFPETQSIELKKALVKEYNLNGWIAEYLILPINNRSATLTLSLPKYLKENQLTVNPKYSMIAWLDQNDIIVYNIKSQSSISLPKLNFKLNSIHFTKSSPVLYGANDQIIKTCTLNEDGTIKDTTDYLWGNQFGELIKDTPTSTIISHIPKESYTFLKTQNNPDQNKQIIKSKALKVRNLGDKGLLLGHEEKIIFQKYPNTEIKINKDTIWDTFSSHSNLLYTIDGQNIKIYLVNVSQTKTAAKPQLNVKLLLEYQLQKEPLRLLPVSHSEESYIVNMKDNSNCLLAQKGNEIFHKTLPFKGKPILATTNYCILLDNDTLKKYPLNEDNLSSNPKITQLFQDQELNKLNQIFIQSINLNQKLNIKDIHKPEPENSKFLAINNNRIELWDSILNKRVTILARPKETIEHIRYSKEINSIITLDSNNKYRTWKL